MKKSAVIGGTVLLAALFVAAWWRMHGSRPESPSPAGTGTPGGVGRVGGGSTLRVRPPRPGALSRAEKMEWAEKIKHDYDEIRAKTSADYTAAAASFPGGLGAFLRQLALLEREKHADLAALLDPTQLEDVEMRDTGAGQLVQRLLGDTEASEEQRRAAFRLQHEFDDRFALTFDVSPPVLIEREAARQAVQEKICAALGDELFAAWLKGEGENFGHFTVFTQQQGLPAGAALDLWRAKNEFTLRRLELSARRDLSNEQLVPAQAQVLRNTQARLMAILGPGAMTAATSEVLGWLPRR